MIRKALALVVLAVVTGCAQKESSVTANQGPTAPALAVIATSIAMPAGYKVDANRTLIFGNDERWTGRLSYSTKTPSEEVFDFLHREMPNFGWTEIASMRSDASLLTFTSEATNRVATIHIARGSMLGSTEVDLVVAPKQAEKSAPISVRAK